MRRLYLTSIVVGLALCVALCIGGQSWAAPLSAEDMYLDPALIPLAEYDFEYHNASYTAAFFGVLKLQVLPAFLEDGVTYYATPTVDYTGDITGTDGSISFLKPGPYYVMATYTDYTTSVFAYGIDFLTQASTASNGGGIKWVKEPTPNPDVVVVDPNEFDNPTPPPPKRNLKESQPKFGPGTTKVDDKTTWEQVTQYLKTLNNKHVEISAHGLSGKVYWGNQLVLDDSTQATKDWLNQMKGHIKILTFMTCKTGSDASFIQLVANSLDGESGGYTGRVGGNGEDWFKEEGCQYVRRIVPEPSSLLVLVTGMSGVIVIFAKRKKGCR